jgi:ferredoxin-NADP reductase
MNYVDSLLDQITTYRLLLYYLMSLIGAAMLLSAFGLLSYNPISIAFLASYAAFICWAVNRCFASFFHIPHNPESSLITGLILALIITPTFTSDTLVFLSVASGLAIASKYLLTIRNTHLFNPAAIAVTLTAFGAGESASWWVGSVQLTVFVVIGGLLLLRKIKKMQMVSIYLATVTLTTLFMALIRSADAIATLQTTFLHSSALFLGSVMLTEPLTSPANTKKQRWYAVFTGIFFSPQIHLFSVFSTPELSLIIGNLFSYIIDPKIRFSPHFLAYTKEGQNVTDFVFTTSRPLRYRPGQYIELTLPHSGPDSRGSRRYFTLASSPTESELHIGMKIPPESSTFKKAMQVLSPQTPLIAGQLAGEFTLPRDHKKKLVFIAGGIGVTPFRSMIKYLVDTNEHRDITLFYIEHYAADLAYTDIFEQAAQQFATSIHYVLTEQTADLPRYAIAGHIDPSLIERALPDYKDHIFYISGPLSMVSATKDILRALGIPRGHIKTDFFPGAV